MACAHGCVYCDGRAERYHVEEDFATDITVRDNLPERLGDRLDLLRQCKAAGLCAGVLAMPLLPYLVDTEDNLRRLFSSLAEIGVDFVVPGSLTLRPGRQKEGFLKTIAEYFPGDLPHYLHLYDHWLIEEKGLFQIIFVARRTPTSKAKITRYQPKISRPWRFR